MLSVGQLVNEGNDGSDCILGSHLMKKKMVNSNRQGVIGNNTTIGGSTGCHYAVSTARRCKAHTKIFPIVKQGFETKRRKGEGSSLGRLLPCMCMCMCLWNVLPSVPFFGLECTRTSDESGLADKMTVMIEAIACAN